MILRPRQIEAVDAIFREWNSVRSTLAVLCTGAGKTVIAAEVIRRLPKRVMFLAERRKLIYQGRKTIAAHTGDSVGIEMGELRTHHLMRDKSVIATVQSLASPHRLEQFNPEEFCAVIVDEAHHATTDSYTKVLDHFKKNPELKVLGITATPDRADEEALGQVFDTVAYEYPLLQAIQEGYLVYPYHLLVDVPELDYTDIRTTAGDLNGADLAVVMEREKPCMKMAQASIEYLFGLEPKELLHVEPLLWKAFIEDQGRKPKKALMFSASVAHAEMMSDIFNRIMPGISEWVSAKTADDKREQIETAFFHGDIPIVCNCGLYFEGYDNPSLDVVIDGAPTKSRTRYAQKVGRVTRTLDGILDGLETAEERLAAIAASTKPIGTVIDFAGNSGKHKLITLPDILGGIISAPVRAILAERAKKEATRIDASVIEEEELKLLEEKKLKEKARKVHLVAKTDYTTQEIDPFNILHIKPQKPYWGHDGKTLAPGHLASLKKNFKGIDVEKLHYSQQMQLLKQVWARQKAGYCTFNMMKILAERGHDGKKMPFEVASNLITQISEREGWRK